MSNNNDNRMRDAETGGRNEDGGRMYPNDPEYDFDENIRRVFLASGFAATDEERDLFARRLTDLLSNDETTGTWAVALWSQQQRTIQDRVTRESPVPSANMTAEQRLEQREAEASLYGSYVVEHHWNQSARLLDDVSANAARLIMTAQEPSDVLTAFTQNLEARIMASMQTALPLEHDEYGRGRSNQN